jgi:tRNA(Arg) A34 adenosine deaminase TadA
MLLRRAIPGHNDLPGAAAVVAARLAQGPIITAALPAWALLAFAAEAWRPLVIATARRPLAPPSAARPLVTVAADARWPLVVAAAERTLAPVASIVALAPDAWRPVVIAAALARRPAGTVPVVTACPWRAVAGVTSAQGAIRRPLRGALAVRASTRGAAPVVIPVVVGHGGADTRVRGGWRGSLMENAKSGKLDPMALALGEAQAAAARGEVPIGAVIVRDGVVVAAAHNRPRDLKDPTAHAEMLAIRAACQALDDERLTGCDLYVTLEPCAMCAAAISFARIRRLYFGASDPKGGAVEHGPRFFAQPTCHHAPEIYGGMRARDAGRLLQDFFAPRR